MVENKSNCAPSGLCLEIGIQLGTETVTTDGTLKDIVLSNGPVATVTATLYGDKELGSHAFQVDGSSNKAALKGIASSDDQWGNVASILTTAGQMHEETEYSLFFDHSIPEAWEETIRVAINGALANKGI